MPPRHQLSCSEVPQTPEVLRGSSLCPQTCSLPTITVSQLFPVYQINTKSSVMGLPRQHRGKESACQLQETWEGTALRSPGGGNGNPFQDSCLENPTHRGAWWATVPWSRQKSDVTEHAHRHLCCGSFSFRLNWITSCGVHLPCPCLLACL